MGRIAILCAAGLCAILACRDQTPRLTSCEPARGITPLCGFSNPEDLVALPGGDFLIASQYRYDGAPPGSLVALRLSDQKRLSLYPESAGVASPEAAGPVAGWGDPACPGPPDPSEFSPHGLDLARREGRAPVLLVVNHGGRQAVEMFEVVDAEAAPTIGWRGCVLVPDRTWPNDVASLPSGGFVVTKSLSAMEGLGLVWSGLRLLLGLPTGHVLEWLPKRGWRVIPGSEQSVPNGVAVSPDGAVVYFSAWGSGAIFRIAREGDPELRSAALGHNPDNITWAPDGRLLVTGQLNGLAHVPSCQQQREGTCAAPFSVVAVDPETLEVEVLLDHDGAAAMGAATVALQLGGDLYLGTFSGDRIAKVSRPPSRESAIRPSSSRSLSENRVSQRGRADAGERF